MQKRYLVLFFIVLFGGLVWFFVQSSMTSSIAINPKPTTPINTSLDPEPQPKPTPTETADIILTTPTAKQSVPSPITISGKAKGTWYFEGSFPITLTNWDGLIMAEGHATAQGEWMTTDYVPFTASLKYTLPKETPYKRGFLILKNDNPSGDPTRDKSIEIEVELQ